MLANKSHLLHSITVNYTQLEPFIAHPLLTLPGLVNPFTALGLSHFPGKKEKGKRNFRRNFRKNFRSGAVGAKTQIVQTCRDNCSLSSVPLTCQWAWKIEFPRFFCALLQLLAGPLSSSQGFSALPVFTTPVLEFVSWVCCDLTRSPFKPMTCVIPNWAAPRFKTKNHSKHPNCPCSTLGNLSTTISFAAVR